ncbi:MAG: phosphoribosylformylglycinamidine synthase subunit PurS [Saprospiraceae bacterium]|nr:phosphoribosylformylglycinamidine synthase subunit PurS [Saprospiraceae bacterium]MBK8450680.1 phosphoribosylformylglycinamidine synthase subunit PurS [Saprospiraceae bacterium]MBK8485240.1 phosphoribosylformylglycinamidine synthase subunit PurS [Saprospiraceae bacterium]MBK9222457.1 phosphoribosylformylglycinamidine synthase subunit PurS [Saprospiraceae bacterium]MBK9720508.1 phosphoribosylformylglycinamidine synthase subunit PurS [Saprospiraceae bacterium]
MKIYKAKIDILPHKELLDPQGKTVAKNMQHLDIQGVLDVRIGKHIEMQFEAQSEAAAKELVENSCKKLLTNMITETFTYSLSEQS